MCLGVSLPLSLCVCVCVCVCKLGQQIGRTLATSVMDCDSQSRALSIRQPSFLVQKSCAAPWSTVCRARAFCMLPCQSEAYPCGRAGHAAHQHDQAARSLPLNVCANTDKQTLLLQEGDGVLGWPLHGAIFKKILGLSGCLGLMRPTVEEEVYHVASTCASQMMRSWMPSRRQRLLEQLDCFQH